MTDNHITDYVANISNLDKKKYVEEIIFLLGIDKKKVAYHGSCTDGLISASLLYYMNKELLFIPLDYNILKDKALRPYLASQEWFAIIDLEPFNDNTIELFVDHHRSIIGSKINAKRIHFELGEFGPSAAFVLYNILKNTIEIPIHLKKLVEVSTVTDTASFKIDPPLDIIDLNQDNVFLEDFDKLCWFVQDATNIEDDYSLELNNTIMRGVSEKGIEFFLSSEHISRINAQRIKRKEAFAFCENVSVTDLMVIINSPNQTFKQFLALYLGKIGAKVIVFLTQKDSLVTISLRQSKKNTPQEIENLRLDLLAKTFNSSGGGHAEASGSISNSIKEAQLVLENWVKEKNLEMSILTYKKNV